MYMYGLLYHHFKAHTVNNGLIRAREVNTEDKAWDENIIVPIYTVRRHRDTSKNWRRVAPDIPNSDTH